MHSLEVHNAIGAIIIAYLLWWSLWCLPRTLEEASRTIREVWLTIRNRGD